jgi:muramidase (phage lysozyme)
MGLFATEKGGIGVVLFLFAMIIASTPALADEFCQDALSGQVTAPPSDVATTIIDNHATGFHASPSWQRRSASGGYHGADYAFRPTDLLGDAAEWRAPIPAAGHYDVLARWTEGDNRSTAAQYIVHHANGKATVTKNQRQNGGAWVKLGTFPFKAGDTLRVELSCWSKPGAVVIADAIRVEAKELCRAGAKPSKPSTSGRSTPRKQQKTTVLFEGKKPVAIGVVQATELSPEVKAFLDTIAAAEGTGDTSSTCGRADDGYGALFGCFEKTSRTFSDYSRHPEKFYKSSTGYRSAASGRYQFLPKTWKWVAPKVGANDISPANQDRAAKWLLGYRKALKHVEAIGADDYEAFKQALYASRKEWASLPASPYGQPTHTAKDLWVVYQAAYARY